MSPEASAPPIDAPPNAATLAVEEERPHIMPLKTLVAVWLSLVVLTLATVGVAQWDFGGGTNLWIAMAIATVKASLVAFYFMHLKYENPFYAIIFGAALLFVFLFIGLSLMDSEHYQQTLIPNYAPLINQ